MDTTMKTPPIVTPQEWEDARQRLLVKEKEVSRARDAVAAERRRMPWLPVEKDYAFDGPDGKKSLLDLFEGRRQLIVYRAFFEPGVHGWPDHACVGCSLMADQVADVVHLNARDITFAYASRAPQPDIARLKARMGWTHPWYTMLDDFDKDHGVDEWHGTNAFIRDGDRRVPHLLPQQPRRRGAGEHLELSRHERARTAGDVGGLTRGLSPDPAVSLVELARRILINPNGAWCLLPSTASAMTRLRVGVTTVAEAAFQDHVWRPRLEPLRAVHGGRRPGPPAGPAARPGQPGAPRARRSPRPAPGRPVRPVPPGRALPRGRHHRRLPARPRSDRGLRQRPGLTRRATWATPTCSASASTARPGNKQAPGPLRTRWYRTNVPARPAGPAVCSPARSKSAPKRHRRSVLVELSPQAAERTPAALAGARSAVAARHPVTYKM